MTRDSIFWGAVLVLAGITLMIGNLLGLEVWGLLWPLLLIAVGLWIVWGVASGRRYEPETETLSIPLEGAEAAKVQLHYGVGALHVAGGAAPDALLAGAFAYGVQHRTKRDGRVLEADLSVPSQRIVQFAAPWNWWQNARPDWDVQLNQNVPLSLEVETGASDVTLDLSALQVRELEISTGASAVEVTLPAAAGHTQVEMEGGAASFKLRVPEGVAARIRSTGGLSGTTVDTTRFPRLGDIYQSPDYDTAIHRVDLKLETGVSSVDVR
ncbi:MAG: hypothetical protein GX605_01520 [Chloroflexi bacterium]|nr:hypothetical protein [Chloroflexota bacterium]